MMQRLITIGSWIGYAIVVIGCALIVQENPKILLLVGLAAIGIVALTAWYDYDHWNAKYFRWRHSDLLSSAATLVDPHLDRLAEEMADTLKWDGRSDYLWEPWVVHSQQFVDTVLIPALTTK